MLISCKCLNFIATSNSSQQQAAATAVAAVTPTADKPPTQSSSSTHLVGASGDGDDCSMSSISSVATQSTTSLSTTGVVSSNNNNNHSNINTIAAALLQAFLQKYPRNFIFYSQCMDLFKQSIGPIPDLTINAVNQREVIYSLTLDIANAQSQSYESWQISICINCNAALCAKRLQHAGQQPPIPPQYLINCSLLTNNEELAHRRADKSFSETFDLLIMDHPQLLPVASSQQQNGASTLPTSNNFSIGSLSSTSGGGGFVPDAKQQRLRQLQHKMQQRLNREIAETDERIQRYTEQQFALLKSFREKSEQEYALLIRLIQRVPEQQLLQQQQQQQQQAGNLAGVNSGEWFDRTPPALDVTGGVVNSYAARRRNTIGSRRDINSTSTTAPTTPTTPNPNNIANMLTLPPTLTTQTSSAMDTSNITTTTQGTAAAVGATTVLASNANRKMSHFDTPPATPEATPMSVGNSPTFRQQQQQIHQQQLPLLQQQLPSQQFGRLAANSQLFQQQFSTPTTTNANSNHSIEPSDDCLFELEGIDSGNASAAPSAAAAPYSTLMSNISLKLPHHAQMQAQQQHQQHFHRSLSIHQHQRENNMSDLDESDDAEEAEDALDLETSLPISMAHDGLRRSTADALNFGKSLPIAIANSPMAARSYMGDTDEDELDNNVDIAASIKALAKSVHGEAVFGDLPRPRLRSQI